MRAPALLPAIAIERRHADQGGDGAAIEPAELRELSEQRARDGGPDARHAAQEVVLHAPDRTALNRGADLLVDLADSAFEPANVRPEVARDRARRRRLREPLPLGDEHLEQLPPPRDQRRQRVRGGIGDGRGVGWTRAPKCASTCRIDRIRFRGAADGLREGAHLARIDDGDREAGRAHAPATGAHTRRSLPPQ